MKHGESEDSDGSDDDNNIVSAILAGRKDTSDIERPRPLTPVADLNIISSSGLGTTSVNPFAGLVGANLTWGSFIVGNFLGEVNRSNISTMVADDENQTGASTSIPTPEVPPLAREQEPIDPKRHRKRPLLTEVNIEAHNGMVAPMSPSKSRSKRHKSGHRRHRSRDGDRDKSHSTHSHRKKGRHEEAVVRSSGLQLTPGPQSFDQQRVLSPAQSFDQRRVLTPGPRRSDQQRVLPPVPQSFDQQRTLTPAPRIFNEQRVLPPVPRRLDQQRAPPPVPNSFDRQHVPANIYIPRSILHRENYKAIKNTPITAGAKARSHISEVQPRKSRTQTTTADENLFKAFEANQPKQKRNQVTEGLVAPENQVELPYSNYPTPAKRTETAFRNGKLIPQPRTNASKKQNTQKELLLQFKNQKNNASRSKAQTQPQPQEDSPPPQLSPRIASPPLETIPAEYFLGPERLVRQWVVYRTARFSPTITTPSGEKITISRDDKAIRCSDHISKNAANDNAHARYERIHKDVVKKSWVLAGETGLYDGVLGYSDGDVQHFWVVEEVTDLTKITNQWKEAGKTMRLDQERAKVYSRKRYDVWSVVVYPPDRQDTAESGKEQVLAVDCGGEGDEDGKTEEAHDGDEDGGEDDEMEETRNGEKDGDEDEEMEEAHYDDDSGKEDVGGSRSPASSDTLIGQEPTNTEKQHPEASSETASLNQTSNNPMVSTGVNTDLTSITTTTTPNKPPTKKDHTTKFNPFTIISHPKVTLHASHTTASAANKAALAMFLELCKPRNARIEDHHYYKHFIAPEMTEMFDEDYARDPEGPVRLIWEASDSGFKWWFLYLEVKVVESELVGVVDLGGFKVRGVVVIRGEGRGMGMGGGELMVGRWMMGRGLEVMVRE